MIIGEGVRQKTDKHAHTDEMPNIQVKTKTSLRSVNDGSSPHLSHHPACYHVVVVIHVAVKWRIRYIPICASNRNRYKAATFVLQRVIAFATLEFSTLLYSSVTAVALNKDFTVLLLSLQNKVSILSRRLFRSKFFLSSSPK